MKELDANIQNKNLHNDWYLYDNKSVKGPLSAQEVFKKNESQSTDIKTGPFFVSKKGFNQWYPLDDLQHIFNATDDLATSVAPLPKVAKKNITTSKTVEKVAKKTEQTINTSSDEKENVKKEVKPHLFTKQDILREYFLQRGRLRIGKLKNPYYLAFVFGPLTIFVAWIYWLNDIKKEVNWHISKTYSNSIKVPPAIFACIPGLHIWVYYCTAKLVYEMELQNKYVVTSPAKAALLSIFPPFALIYLQNRLNTHWNMHVKFSLSSK